MNKTELELNEVTGVEKEATESQDDYLLRLFQAVVQLSQEDWDALSYNAQSWYTDAVPFYDADEKLPPISKKYDSLINEDTTDKSTTVLENIPVEEVVETQGTPIQEKVEPVKHKRRNLQKNVDKFGFKIGSKTSIAAKAFEAGATMEEVIRLTGAKHYNMLKKLAAKGHEVYQEKDGRFVVKFNENASN